MKSFNNYLKEQMKDPNFEKDYHELEEEYDGIINKISKKGKNKEEYRDDGRKRNKRRKSHDM